MTQLPAFGPDARLHHIGIAVRSIAAVNSEIQIFHDPIQRVRVAFFEMHDLLVELIEPAGDDSPVQRSLNQGVKLLHTCFEVDRLESSMDVAREAGYHPIRHPAPAVAFGGRRIVWVFHRELGLVELLERTAKNDLSRDYSL